MSARDELVTVTVRRSDLEEAISAMGYAHANYCTSGSCVCGDGADRLEQQLDLSTAREAYLHSTRRAMLGLEWDDLPTDERLRWIRRAIAKREQN